jgi:hypothetical protein
MADSSQPVPLTWRRSTFSEAGSCVEVTTENWSVLARDSKDTLGPALEFPAQCWVNFVIRIKNGTIGNTIDRNTLEA